MNAGYSFAQLTGAIDRARQCGAYAQIPVLTAVRAGLIAAVFVSRRDAPISMRALKRYRVPVLVVVGDDDHAATGPSDWTCIEPLMRWGRAVVVHGAGAKPEHYIAAVEGARALGRLVLVETDSAHLMEWVATAGLKLRLAIVATDGLHLITPAMEDRH